MRGGREGCVTGKKPSGKSRRDGQKAERTKTPICKMPIVQKLICQKADRQTVDPSKSRYFTPLKAKEGAKKRQKNIMQKRHKGLAGRLFFLLMNILFLQISLGCNVSFLKQARF
jgi:hypothetical protein